MGAAGTAGGDRGAAHARRLGGRAIDPPTPSSPSLTALYRAILRAHRTLPPPLRDLGDRTVRAEWAAMVRAAPPADSWATFAAEWRAYVRQLTHVGSGSGGLQPDQVAAMSADQLRSLQALKAEAERARAALVGDGLPPHNG